MNITKFKLTKALVGCGMLLLAGASYALPALQLGPTGGDPSTGWTYDTTTQTWVFSGDNTSTANLSGFANATAADGGNGDYAWDADGATNQYAYLVVAATPQSTGTGLFSVTVAGATLFDEGNGTPPVEDPNSIAPHGIFDTYFQIWQFQFAGLEDIYNTQPPGGDTAKGYKEDFAVTITSIDASLTGLHFDLFTVTGDGTYTPGQADNNKLVKAVAPFSHDAEWECCGDTGETGDETGDTGVPVPGTLALLGLGLLGLARSRRRKAV